VKTEKTYLFSVKKVGFSVSRLYLMISYGSLSRLLKL
jgi:hypothetical protein